MIPITQREQARRAQFASPTKTYNTPSTVSPAKPQVESSARMQNLQRASPQKHTDTARPAPPSLTVATNFSRHRQPSLHRHGSSIQERRKRKAPSPAVSNPLSALSPSEGTLMIGLSVQPDTIELHKTPQSPSKSMIPDIVISPTGKPVDNSQQAKNWRPRSSVYSQMTRLSRSFSTSQIPPVPQLPVLNQHQTKPRPTSAVSWHTDFSDDNQDHENRRFSRNTEPGKLVHLTIATIDQASEGWWNTMLSPIFGRSNTIFGKSENKPTASTSKQIVVNQQPAQDLTMDTVMKTNSPNIWESLDRIDAQRQTLALFANNSPIAAGLASAAPGTLLTPEIVQEGGFGLASEYYEASWHDAYSSSPFFECHGHDCSQKITYKHGKTIGGPDAEPVLAKLTATNLASIQSALTDSRDNRPRMEENARELGLEDRPQTPNHARNDSVETFIEDMPDAKSQLRDDSPMLSSTANSPLRRTNAVSRQGLVAESRSTPSASNTGALPSGRPTKNISRLEDLGELSESDSKRGLAISQPRSVATSKRKSNDTPGKTIAGSSLEDPFHDMYRCESPESYNSPRYKDATSRNGTPQKPPRALTPASTDASSVRSARHDPLKINEPRKAPTPPRSVLSQNTPYAQSVGSVSTLRLPNPASMDRKMSETRSRTTADAVPVITEKAAMRPGNQLGRSNLYLSTDDLVSEKFSKPVIGAKSNNTRGTLPPSPPEEKEVGKKRKRWYFVIGSALLALIILIIVLVLLFTLHRNDAPVQTTWLNITGYPPVPTGIATIAQPNAAIEESRCVAPNTLWSCAVPKEQQASIAPNLPDQPNFRLEIRFQNDSSALGSNSSLNGRSIGSAAVVAGAYKRNWLLQARDAFTTSLFSPNPAPPSSDDQTFLGNTTDNNTLPFAGEATPFFISFLPTTVTGSSSSALSIRDNSDPFPNVTNSIPPPSTNPDGTALAANLLPFPSAQPLMLYNRGRADEHYGFYTYFDRSIFLKSTDLLNSTGPDIPDNYNGGAAADAADVRCTWAQTRFLVQIWTSAGSALQLLSSNDTSGTNSSSNSANNFTQPGSFPYPVSITLDRHGGDETEKMIYCYGMDENQHIISFEKQVHLENRAFGGPGLVNPGRGLFSSPANTSLADGGPGGIDGGFGGCKCQWRNWVEA